MSLKKSIVTAFAITVLGIGIGGCTKEDTNKTENKRSPIDNLISNANDISGQHDPRKDEQLQKILKSCDLRTMNTLQNAGITILIDDRLDTLVVDGIVSPRIRIGVYYPSSKTLSLPSSYWDTDVHWNAGVIKALAHDIEYGEIPNEPIFFDCRKGYLNPDYAGPSWRQGLFSDPISQKKPETPLAPGK